MEGIARVDARVPELTKEEEFTHAVAPHYTALVRRLTVVVGDLHAGQDLAQETYLRAFRAWSRFDGREVRGWLYTIGLHLAFNELDRRRRWAGILGPRPAREPWIDAYDPQVGHAMASLSREQRAALLLSAVDGYTQSEIASMLGVAPGTVASWIARGKAKLREELSR